MKKKSERRTQVKTLGRFEVVELEDACLADVRGDGNCGCYGGECNEVEGCGTDVNTVAGCACKIDSDSG